jgi:uncharacterized protein (TIGR00156 family)
MKRHATLLLCCLASFLAPVAMAQFTGPSTAGRPSTVAETRDMRIGSYVTLTGNVINHLRGDYFTFQDATGEIRAEIHPSVWNGRKVGPTDKVQILGEIESGSGGRYIWVKTLTVQ